MTVNDAVIGTRILVSVGSAGRVHRAQGALQDIRGIRSMFLHDIVRERNRQAFCDESRSLFPLRRSNQVGRAEFVVISPSPPVRELFQRAVVVRFVGDGRARTVLTLCLREGSRRRSQRDQANHQDSHVSSSE